MLLDIALDLFLNDGEGVREEARYLKTGISKEKLDEIPKQAWKEKR